MKEDALMMKIRIYHEASAISIRIDIVDSIDVAFEEGKMSILLYHIFAKHILGNITRDRVSEVRNYFALKDA